MGFDIREPVGLPEPVVWKRCRVTGDEEISEHAGARPEWSDHWERQEPRSGQILGVS